MSDNIPLRHILILDDDPDYRKLLLKYLAELFPDTKLTEYDPVANGVPEENFDWSSYDAMLLDYNLSLQHITGLEVLKTHAAKPAFPTTIMLTGAGNEDVAIRAMKSGIYDYLRKQTMDREQLKKSILDAHAKHLADLKQKDAVAEARKAASKVAALAFEDYKSRYESIHAAEVQRFKGEIQNLRVELDQSRQTLTQVEKEKEQAVRSLEDIEQELVRFKQGESEKDSRTIQETRDKLEELQKGIEDSERKRQRIEGEIQKNIWKQEQGQMKLEQIEEDLRLFNEEFETGQNDKNKISAQEFEKIKKTQHKSDLAAKKKKENDLLSDVSSLLGKKD